MDWEENQLEERTYRKAKERLAKGGIGHTVMRAGGWTVREIGSKKTIPPWGSWDTGVLKNPGRGGPGVKLEELTVVGRALGHCYQKGALQQSYAANIVKGRLGLLSIFSPTGCPLPQCPSISTSTGPHGARVDKDFRAAKRLDFPSVSFGGRETSLLSPPIPQWIKECWPSPTSSSAPGFVRSLGSWPSYQTLGPASFSLVCSDSRKPGEGA